MPVDKDQGQQQARKTRLPADPPTLPLEPRTIQVGSHQRTLVKHAVTFRCEWCGSERTVLQYPGPPPRYCAPPALCKRAAQAALAKHRMRAMRDRKNPLPAGWRRGPGRPKHDASSRG